MSSRREENARRTRAEIVAAATTLFGTKGFRDVSIGDICSAVGLSRGGFYHHFDSREACFEAVWISLQDEWAAHSVASSAAAEVTDIDVWEFVARSFRELFAYWAEPIRRQINLYDPLPALGWERCQELTEANGIAQVAEMLAALERRADPMTARLVYAAIAHATFHVGSLGCPDDLSREAAAGLVDLIRDLDPSDD